MKKKMMMMIYFKLLWAINVKAKALVYSILVYLLIIKTNALCGGGLSLL